MFEVVEWTVVVMNGDYQACVLGSLVFTDFIFRSKHAGVTSRAWNEGHNDDQSECRMEVRQG